LENSGLLERLIEVPVIENADHSLEITGDIVQSIQVLEGIIGEIQKFLG
jgi:hypothetical protein